MYIKVWIMWPHGTLLCYYLMISKRPSPPNSRKENPSLPSSDVVMMLPSFFNGITGCEPDPSNC
uniref:Uncharacterized protein MANES_12G006600 n=1 Tax=Rhizophora mucronata TaxID=61149 RepID=A0A2P2IM54_RHIMU